MYLHLLEQHVENASFLWRRRDAATRSHHVRLADLLRLDERVEANLDGLRVAGATGRELAQRRLERGGPGELFTCAVLAAPEEDPGPFGELVGSAGRSRAGARAMASALGWLGAEGGLELATVLLDPELPPALRWQGLAAFAAWRRDPGTGVISEALASRASELRARALRAVGELGQEQRLDEVERQLRADAPLEVRVWAGWAAARLGSRRAEDALWLAAREGGEGGALAAQVAAAIGDPERSARELIALAENAATARSALLGIEACGRPALLSEALALAVIGPLARLAGSVVSGITGADLRAVGAAAPRPPDLSRWRTLADDADVALPWPDPQRLAAWWQRERDRFDARAPYLVGRPRDAATLAHVLGSGMQRHRSLAALLIGRAAPRRPFFPLSAPGWVQAAALAEASGMLRAG